MQPIDLLRNNVSNCFFGNRGAIDRVITCLLAGGHILIEDVPGVGKTMLANALARSIDCSINRAQMTPDMLPADIIGVTVWDQQQSEFKFKPGPIFTNILLADEVNRTTPRTQSALLEAMNEAQVSIDGTTHKLLAPFFVLATQNPFEFEGTYFLPESQLDRFLMRIKLGYPSPEDESRVLLQDPARTALAQLKPVLTTQAVLDLQKKVDEVTIDPSLVKYIVQIAAATREHEQLQVGVSPRGTLALTRCAKATAVLNGRDYCVPDDVVSNVVPVFAHRVSTKAYLQDGDTVSAERIMQMVLEQVPSPV